MRYDIRDNKLELQDLKLVKSEDKMTVKFLGESDPLYFINGREYEVLGAENGLYRITDETGEDYLYSLEEFEIVL